MPSTTPCIICRKVGFVRTEREITGAMALTRLYCGACEHTWAVADGDSERRAKPRPLKVGLRKPSTYKAS